jgi:hypothetical protein
MKRMYNFLDNKPYYVFTTFKFCEKKSEIVEIKEEEFNLHKKKRVNNQCQVKKIAKKEEDFS